MIIDHYLEFSNKRYNLKITRCQKTPLQFHVCPSVAPSIFAVLCIPFFSFSELLIKWYTQFGGGFHSCLNFVKFRFFYCSRWILLNLSLCTGNNDAHFAFYLQMDTFQVNIMMSNNNSSFFTWCLKRALYSEFFMWEIWLWN